MHRLAVSCSNVTYMASVLYMRRFAVKETLNSAFFEMGNRISEHGNKQINFKSYWSLIVATYSKPLKCRALSKIENERK